MANGPYWVRSPWPGRLAVSARPRGGDWLEDEAANWKRDGINAVVSLLTPEEEQDLDLHGEKSAVRNEGVQFISLPIQDRQVPSSQTEFARTLEKVAAMLAGGKNVLVHCRQGIGRSGLVAACLLVVAGFEPEAAMKEVSAARGVPIPETAQQSDWVSRYAAALAQTR